MDFAAARRAMVDSQLRPQAVTDPLVVAAMATVPRELFVPESSRTIAYIDRVVPLKAGRGLSPAVSLGRLLVEAELRPAERALVVGAGSGYSAAVLAEMALEVTALESDPELVGVLSGLNGVTVVEGPLEAGVEAAAPFDFILVDGQIEELGDALAGQLRVGGRLAACMIENGVGRLAIGRRSAHGFGLKSFADGSMAPLPGFARPPVFTF